MVKVLSNRGKRSKISSHRAKAIASSNTFLTCIPGAAGQHAHLEGHHKAVGLVEQLAVSLFAVSISYFEFIICSRSEEMYSSTVLK